jgi:TatA/E family protein of Tat protein translocase
MGSLGLPEIAFIFVLALLIFGPKKLPEIGRTVGKGVAEFRKATNELKRTLNTELVLEETPAPPVLRPRRLEEPAEAQREVRVEEPPHATEPWVAEAEEQRRAAAASGPEAPAAPADSGTPESR